MKTTINHLDGVVAGLEKIETGIDLWSTKVESSDRFDVKMALVELKINLSVEVQMLKDEIAVIEEMTGE